MRIVTLQSTAQRPEAPERIGIRFAATLATAAALLLPLTTEGATHQLSQGQSFSEICVDCNGIYYNHLFSPDGKWAVYAQDVETDGHYALWSAPVAGGAPVRLSATLGEGDSLLRFQVSPDSSRVSFLAYTLAGGIGLYSVPIGGPASASIRVNLDLAPTESIYRFDLTPSNTVLYLVSESVSSSTNLWQAPIGGGSSSLVNVPLAQNERVFDFWFEPVSARVLYTIYHGPVGPDATLRLWSVPLAGGPQTLLVELPGPDPNLGGCEFTSNGPLALCVSSHGPGSPPFELWSYPVAGGTAVRLDSAPPPLALGVTNFEIARDDSRVVYASDQATAGVIELWSVPTTGGPSQRLNGDLVVGGDVANSGFAISPDNTRVAYLADQETDETVELWSVPIAGGDALKLNPPLPTGGDVTGWTPSGSTSPLISADGSHVAYIADQEVDNRFEVWSVPIAGGTSARVGPAFLDGTWIVNELRSAAGGAAVVFNLQYLPEAGGFENFLFWSPIGAPFALDVLGLDDPVAGTSYFTPSPTSPREVLFQSNLSGGTEQLFLADTCLLCDGFESGLTVRWSAVSP